MKKHINDQEIIAVNHLNLEIERISRNFIRNMRANKSDDFTISECFRLSFLQASSFLGSLSFKDLEKGTGF